MNCYTSLRKKREEFKNTLLDMMKQVELINEQSTSTSQIVDGGEEDLLKYYFYIKQGIDDEHVAPIESVLLKNILNLVPKKLKTRFKKTLEIIVDDAKQDYAVSLKKSIVDFVLQDPTQDNIIINNQEVCFNILVK